MSYIREVIIVADLSDNTDASRLKSKLEREGKKVGLFLLPDTTEQSVGLIRGTIIAPPSLFSIYKGTSECIELIRQKQADALFDLSLSHPQFSRILVAMADASLKVAVCKEGNDFVDIRMICDMDSTLEDRFDSMSHYLNLLCPPEEVKEKEEKKEETLQKKIEFEFEVVKETEIAEEIEEIAKEKEEEKEKKKNEPYQYTLEFPL